MSGLRQPEQVVVPTDILGVVLEEVAAEVLLGKLQPLDRGALRALEHEDPLGHQGLESAPCIHPVNDTAACGPALHG